MGDHEFLGAGSGSRVPKSAQKVRAPDDGVTSHGAFGDPSALIGRRPRLTPPLTLALVTGLSGAGFGKNKTILPSFRASIVVIFFVSYRERKLGPEGGCYQIRPFSGFTPTAEMLTVRFSPQLDR